MVAIGCLTIIGLIGVLALEVWGYILVSQWLRQVPQVGTGYLEAAIILVVLMFIGWRIFKYHMAAIPPTLVAALTGQGGYQGGRHMVGMVAGILLVFPGFFTAALGLLLIIPPVPYLFAPLAQRFAISMAKRTFQKMMAQGGIPGMAGFPGAGMPGFPGAGGIPPGAFPGGFPGAPDDRVFKPRPKPRTFDTTAERTERSDGTGKLGKPDGK